MPRLMSAAEAECLKEIMMEAADDRAKWNCTLEELGLENQKKEKSYEDLHGQRRI